MPIYEYRCGCGQEFEELKLMSQCSESSVCPQCGVRAERKISSMHYRMAEPFSVVDNDGNTTQKKQVLNNMPDWRESKPEVNPGITLPILARNGNVYYPRKQRGLSNASV